MKTVRIALIQMKVSAVPEENIQRAIHKIQEAARKGAQVICLPELFCFPYFPQTRSRRYFKWAQPVPGPLTRIFQKAAAALNVVLVVPVFEKCGRFYYNSSVVIDADGKQSGLYRKMHIPNDPGYYERFYFSPGNRGFRVFKTRYGKIAVLICWDQWFPEAARLAALQGARIIFYPTAIGRLKKDTPSEGKIDLEAWQLIQRSHAAANSVFVASVNRTGQERNIHFWGSSFAAGPKGEWLARASKTREETIFAACDFNHIREQRKKWLFFEGRRPETYRQLAVPDRNA